MTKKIGRELYELFKQSWDKDTSWNEDYGTFDHPASYGQCGVTSLVLQHYIGGDICKGTVYLGGHPQNGLTTTHYWLKVDGMEFDYTWDQFKPYAVKQFDEVIQWEQLLVNEFFWSRWEQLFLKIRDGIGHSSRG